MKQTERIARLEEKVEAVHQDLHAFAATFDRLWQAIEDLRKELIGRPSWSVVFALTVMSSLTVAALGSIVVLLMSR